MNRPSEEVSRVLTLLRLDAQRLFERIKYRQQEYMYVFSSKRTREYFPQIFRNRYAGTALTELKHCSSEVIIALDDFYHKADELHWYLQTTEEMPATVEEALHHHIGELEKYYETLQLYIKAEFDISHSE